MRCDQLSEHLISVEGEWSEATLGKEDAPFIFAPSGVSPRILAETMIDLLPKSNISCCASGFMDYLNKEEVRWCPT